ncbi:glycosyltransferase [Ruegeria arenilitoris]|uniref:glycosyltransferase n=1 Tax=Ruegeria arenilitoris TaxID=1173585 RepID=UPI00147D7574|nr:glycosyltransferase [Ruegeria arenilitoris]
MRISIVTAVSNRADTLAQALTSVGEQSHSQIEHLEQDGGSIDGTLEVLLNWQGERPLNWHSAPDQGLYDALNRGIGRCRGDVIGMLHSDDVFADADVVADVARASACEGSTFPPGNG